MSKARRFDHGVAVVGGGPAGIAAALAAAGCGADVLLLERTNALGGNVSQALVHTICGLYLPSNSREEVQAHAGVPRAFTASLKEAGGTGAVDWSGQAGFLPIDPATYAAEAARLCNRSGRIERVNGASLTRVTPTDSSIELCFQQPGGTSRVVHAWTVIDASGDANAATLAGARTESASSAQLQHLSFIFRVDGIDALSCDGMQKAKATLMVARAARLERIPPTASSVVLRPGLRSESLYVTLNLPKPADEPFDPLSPVAMARTQQAAQADAEAVFTLLRNEHPAFAGASIGAWPARVGVRESRRVTGLARLEESELLHGRRRDDEACLSTWPVELWQDHERLTFRPVAGAASVPLGSLVADHPTRRLAMAGRCLSASHEALGALRVIGTAMATGEAAGTACALALRHGSDLSAITPAAVRRSIASGLTTSQW